MECSKKKHEFRLLFLITTPRLAEKAEALFEKGRVPLLYRFHAEGTASDEMMEMLGLGSVEKMVLICVLPKLFADEMLKKLKKELKIGSSNSGIAATVPLSGGSGRLVKMLEAFNAEHGSVQEKGEETMTNSHSLILTVVNQGFSGDVMNAARPEGAGGGTVFSGRRLVSGETTEFWGISVHQEKEIVGIVAEADNKMAIMKAIGENCGIHSEANGIVLSLPVENVIGLD